MKKIYVLLMLLGLSFGKTMAQCQANFTYTLNAAGNVTFSNTSVVTSTAPIFWWDFGDNSSSSALSPNHTYSTNGTYIVSLNLADSFPTPCYDTYTAAIVISNTACAVSANASTVQSANGLVYFTNNSTGVLPSTTYTIGFGDNTSATFTNFIGTSHTYSASGNYFFYMQVANSPSCISIYSTMLNVVVQSCSLNANFAHSVNGGTVSFNNTSVGTSTSTQYYWDFGNFNNSFQQNPAPEVYLYNGTYTVSLTVLDSVQFFCSSTITKTITITNAPCYVNSTFAMAKDSSALPAIVWNAYPNYPLNVTSVTWSWGDNSTSNALYPSHTYSAAGFYNICLTVSVSCGSQSTTCFNASINRSSENNAIATVNVINQTTGLAQLTGDPLSEVVIYPNPNNGQFTLNGIDKRIQRITVLNMLGQSVYTQEVNEQEKLDLNLDLPKGIYFVQMGNASGLSQTKKIVIQ